MTAKLYVPTEKAGNWIMGRWRPTDLLLTDAQAADELRRGTIRLKDAPTPESPTTPLVENAISGTIAVDTAPAASDPPTAASEVNDANPS